MYTFTYLSLAVDFISLSTQLWALCCSGPWARHKECGHISGWTVVSTLSPRETFLRQGKLLTQGFLIRKTTGCTCRRPVSPRPGQCGHPIGRQQTHPHLPQWHSPKSPLDLQFSASICKMVGIKGSASWGSRWEFPRLRGRDFSCAAHEWEESREDFTQKPSSGNEATGKVELITPTIPTGFAIFSFQNETAFMHFLPILKEYEKFKHYRESPSPSIPWREILLMDGYILVQT